MTSLKLFYQRGASAALLLGLIVGAPDIAQAQPPGGWAHAIRPSAPYIPPSAPYIAPPSSSGTPAFTPQRLVPPGLPLGTPLPVALPHPLPVALPHAPPVKPDPGPDAGTGPATGGIGDGGAGIDLTHCGDACDTGGEFFRKPAY
jgi:hypothetical protein